MSSIVQLVLDYCRGDYMKMEKELDKLRSKALELETDSQSDDSDYEPEDIPPDSDDESDYEDEIEEERITVIRYKSGHTRIL